MNGVATVESRPVSTETTSNCGYVHPQVDVFETNEHYVLTADMPGVNKNGVEILLEGNELTIIGRRSIERPDGSLLHREISERDFRRVFALDPEIDSEKITARMEQGVLVLYLPKSEKVKPRKIAITG